MEFQALCASTLLTHARTCSVVTKCVSLKLLFTFLSSTYLSVAFQSKADYFSEGLPKQGPILTALFFLHMPSSAVATASAFTDAYVASMVTCIIAWIIGCESAISTLFLFEKYLLVYLCQFCF